MKCGVGSCGNTATTHVLTRCRPCGTDRDAVCRACLRDVLGGSIGCTECRTVATHVADHPLALECRHPHSSWVDDHCEIDGLEIPAWVDELERETA